MVYWQGLDTPASWHSNLHNDERTLLAQVDQGAQDLAGFEYAMRKDIPEDAYTSYDAYSYAAAVVGTAARRDAVGSTEDGTAYGVQADAIEIVGPVGFGIDVHSRDDLANGDVKIEWTETRNDPVALRRDGFLRPTRMPYTNHLDGSFEDLMEELDARRLEPGTHDLETGDRLLGYDGPAAAHGEYYEQGSHSQENRSAIANGGEAYIFIEDEVMDEKIEPVRRDGASYFYEQQGAYEYRVDLGDESVTVDTLAEARALVVMHHAETVEVGPDARP